MSRVADTTLRRRRLTYSVRKQGAMRTIQATRLIGVSAALKLLWVVQLVHTHRLSQDEIALSQCPCVKTADGGYNCQPYDRNLMAVTEEEAILNFKNLVEEPDRDTVIPETQQMTLQCVTEQCKACSAQRIVDLRRKQFISVQTALDLFNSMNLSPSDSAKPCPTVKAYLQGSYTAAQNATVDALNRIIRFGRDVMEGRRPLTALTSLNSGSDIGSILNQRIQTLWPKGGLLPLRPAQQLFPFQTPRHMADGTRRQSDSASGELGEVGELNCVRRGDVPQDDSDDYVHLCSQCWAWRRLPDNYYPQIINELRCKEGDASCLGGYADCRQTHRSLTVLRRDSGTWRQVNLPAASACDCKVPSGSVLHAWIAK